MEAVKETKFGSKVA